MARARSVANGAHASRIKVCDREWRVRRDFDLILRLEERFGPLGPLLARLRQPDVTVAEHIAMLEEILADQDSPPSTAQIRDWIFDKGVLPASAACLVVVAALFTGAERAAESDDDEDEERGEPIMDPPRASSDGAG